jgi:hypothetical protein
MQSTIREYDLSEIRYSDRFEPEGRALPLDLTISDATEVVGPKFIAGATTCK